MRSFAVVILVSLISLSTIAQKQKKPKIFKPFYFGFGINMPTGNFGTAPLLSNNAKQNILAGYYGTKKLGYLFEFGSKLYFNGRDHKLRFGLDWTFLSLNYNEMDWDAYTTAKGGSITEPRVYSVSTKLGPVISYNIVEKLVVDAHFQVAPVAHYSTFEYSRSSGNTEVFQFNADKISDLYGGIKTSGGIGVRWGTIGLAADYFSGKLNTPYTYDNVATGDNSSNAGALKAKISTATIQLKLTLNL